MEDELMLVEVDRVDVPAWSTIGYGEGTDIDTGARVRFTGDHRPMRHLGDAVAEGVFPIVELEDWQIMRVGRGQADD